MPADTHEHTPGHICWFIHSVQNMKRVTLLPYVTSMELHRLTVGGKSGAERKAECTHTLVDAFSTCTDFYIYKYPYDIISQFVFDL